MQLNVNYLGLELKTPLIVSASPFSNHVDKCLQMQDNGISAVVMHSLFEEQINQELHEVDTMLFSGKDSFAEALDFFPENEFENYEMDNYLAQLELLKEKLDIPVIASLNGVSSGGWLDYAKTLQDAGADALELNIYYPASNSLMDAAAIEARYIDNIKKVHEGITIPFAVKLSPFFTSLPHFVQEVEAAGADSLVLFNRFYQPDIDLENLEWKSVLYKSGPYDFSQTLRSIAYLYGQTKLQLSASGGVVGGEDIIKAVMAGATTVGMASALYDYGIGQARKALDEAVTWMEEREYESFDQMRGSISYQKAPNPAAFERANYVDLVHTIDWSL